MVLCHRQHLLGRYTLPHPAPCLTHAANKQTTGDAELSVAVAGDGDGDGSVADGDTLVGPAAVVLCQLLGRLPGVTEFLAPDPDTFTSAARGVHYEMCRLHSPGRREACMGGGTVLVFVEHLACTLESGASLVGLPGS
jgi:hypothetical protein